jgi:hypothetical protein
VYVIILAAIIVSCGGAYTYLSQQCADSQAKADEATQSEARYNDVETKSKSAQSSIPAMDEVVTYAKNLAQYNGQYPDFYRRLARFTSNKVLISSLVPDEKGSTLTIVGYAANIETYGRYADAARLDPDITGWALTGSPLSGTTGSTNGQAIPIPALPPGVIAHFPHSNVPIESYTVSDGKVVDINGGGAQSRAGNGMMQGMGANSFGRTSFAPANRTGGAKTAAFNYNSGFSFQVSATIKPLAAAPAVPGAASGGAAGGASARPQMGNGLNLAN